MNDLDLAVVGNCIVAALIDRQARIVWMGFPRFDRDPIFCRLLDDGVRCRESPCRLASSSAIASRCDGGDRIAGRDLGRLTRTGISGKDSLDRRC